MAEKGRKRQKQVEGLPNVCILMYLIIVKFLIYVWRIYSSLKRCVILVH